MNDKLQSASTFIIDVTACRKALCAAGVDLATLTADQLHDISFMKGMALGIARGSQESSDE